MIAQAFVRDLVFLLVAAFIGGSLAKRFRYPAALGELAVGIIVGPFALGFVEYSDTLVTFAEIDQSTESVKIIIDGNDIHIDSVRHSLGEPSAAIHSVDEVAVAKKRK